MQTIWLSPTDYVSGDPTVRISYPFASHPGTLVTCTRLGDDKSISIGLRLPPHVSIQEVMICYQISTSHPSIAPMSSISRIQLVEMSTPNPEVVLHDDGADLNITSPECYSSNVGGKTPTGAVMLVLRLNFQDLRDQILLGAVGVKVQPLAACVKSIAELRALNAGVAPCLTLLGYDTAGDGGGGSFYWDSEATETDNGGTIIVPNTKPAAGRWKRLVEGTLLVKWFGAKGNGSTDDTTPIQKALDVAKEYGETVCFAPGTYVVDSRVGGPSSAALTIPADGIRLLGSGSGSTVIKAKDGCDFETIIYADRKTGVQIADLTVDSNQANRARQLTTRTIGINFRLCVESKVSRCVIKNNIGSPSGSPPGVGIGFSFTTRCVIESCIIEDSGVRGNEELHIPDKTADGCYTSGTQNLIIGCTARNCLDTAFVLESSNQSGIIGCTAVGCSAGAGITTFISEACRGNFINGLTVYHWNAAVTGGICVGVLAGGTGNLVNTQISNVLLERKGGAGTALNVRQPVTKGVWNETTAYVKDDTVTFSGIGYVALKDTTKAQPPNENWAPIGRTVGLTLQGIHIKGAETQGIALEGAEHALVIDCHIIDTKGAGILIQPGCSKVFVSNNYLATQTSSSIAVNYKAPDSRDLSAIVDDVTINNNVIVGDSHNTSNGIYFFNTCHRATALWNTITNMSVARVGSDPGTTPTVIDAFSASSGGILFGKQADAALYRPSASMLQTKGAFTIGDGGTPIRTHISQIENLNFSAPASAPGKSDLTVTVAGAAIGDTVAVAAPVPVPGNFILTAFVSAPDKVTIRWLQFSDAVEDPDGAGGAYRIDVWKH